MPDSPHNRNWYDRPSSLVIGSSIGAFLCGLVIYWDKVEAHVPRMWNLAAGLFRTAPPPPTPPPATKVVVEAPKPPPAPPPKPTVAPLRNVNDMRDMFRGL